MGLRGHVEACRRDIICAPRSCKRPIPHSEDGTCGKRDPKGGHAQVDRGGRRGGRVVDRSGLPHPQGSMVPDEGVVSVYG